VIGGALEDIAAALIEGGDRACTVGSQATPMSGERLEVSVTFVPAKGYVASAPKLRSPVTALSLGGLRRRIEALLLPDEVIE
jgi:hypothetical protein